MKAAIDGAEGIRSRFRLLIILIQSMILAVLVLVAILYPSFNNNPERYIYLVCVVILILFAWTLWSWRALTGNLFNPYILFMTAAFAFDAGYAFLEIFHLNTGGIFGGLLPARITLETLFLVTISLAAFHSGALVAAFTRVGKPRLRRTTEKQEQDGRSLRLVGWALIGIAAIPTVLVLKQYFTAVSSYGYQGLFSQLSPTGFGAWYRVLAEFLVPGSLFLLAGSKGKRAGIIASSGIIIVFCALMFLLGERGSAIVALLVYLWLLHRIIRKVPKIAIAVIAILLIVVLIPSFAIFRSATGPERYSWARFIDDYRSIKNPALASLSEMGHQMVTIAYTIDLVPRTRAYDMGASYYYGLLTVFPNLFWNVHPTIARGLQQYWLIENIIPSPTPQIETYTYSFIAEAYLNFGWWGAPIFLCLLGFLFGSLVLWADRSSDIARLAMVAAFLVYFIGLPKAETALVARGLVWYSFLPYLAVRFLSYARSREREDMSEVPMGPFRTED